MFGLKSAKKSPSDSRPSSSLTQDNEDLGDYEEVTMFPCFPCDELVFGVVLHKLFFEDLKLNKMDALADIFTIFGGEGEDLVKAKAHVM